MTLIGTLQYGQYFVSTMFGLACLFFSQLRPALFQRRTHTRAPATQTSTGSPTAIGRRLESYSSVDRTPSIHSRKSKSCQFEQLQRCKFPIAQRKRSDCREMHASRIASGVVGLKQVCEKNPPVGQ